MIEPRSDTIIPGSGYNRDGESELPTQKTINKEKKRYCDKIREVISDTGMWRESYKGCSQMLERKKCLFLWTEENYRRYRNTDITIGTELLQSNEVVKNCIATTIKKGEELSGSLKSIFKLVKDVKVKMNDLREAACKLESCMNDSCNCDQMLLITGEIPEHCQDTERPKKQKKPPKECEGISETLDLLVCMPKALSFDIDSIFKSSSEVIGIQVFSNIHTLEPLQKSFSEQAKSFEKHMAETMKSRESDLKKVREELVKIVENTTLAEIQTYKKRSDYQGLEETINFMCEPSCDCIKTGEDCEKRLDDCEKQICDICKEVHETFCTSGNGENTASSRLY